MAEISITYDLLFDVLRNEKSRDDLQQIDPKFYMNVVDYINSKEAIISNPNTQNGERELTRIQLSNIKKLLLELYDRREKKIINLAIYKIKTGSGMISTEGILAEEKILFDKLYSELYKHRVYTINNIVDGKAPIKETAITTVTETSNVRTAPASSIDLIDDSDFDASLRSIRFIKPVPKFLGPELETYGPFEENDIASLPSKIAAILVSRERAENINIE